MRCSDCLAEMTPYQGGFRCRRCGRISDPQLPPEDDKAQALSSSDGHGRVEPPGKARRPGSFRGFIVLASLAAFMVALGAGWYFAPLTTGPAVRSATGAAQGADLDAAASGVTPLETSAIFSDLPLRLGVRQSLDVPAGLTLVPAGSVGAPALVLVPEATAEAILLVVGRDGRTLVERRVWLPPAGRLEAISRAPDGNLFVASRQASGRVLQKISANGETLWTETLANGPEGGVAITLPLSGDGVLVLASSKTGGAAGMEGTYFDADGNRLWSRRLSSTAGPAFARTTPFDEFLVILEETDQVSLITLDREGGEAWRRHWPKPGGHSVASVAMDALGSVFVLMTPEGELFSFNSVGSPELDLVLPAPAAGGDRACTLWPGPATVGLLCPGVTGVEFPEYSRTGERLDAGLLETPGEWRDVQFLVADDLLLAWSAGADGALSIDLLGPVSPGPAGEGASLAPAVADTSGRTRQGAPRMPDAREDPAQAPQASPVPAPDLTPAPPRPGDTGPDRSEVLPVAWQTLSCRFSCTTDLAAGAKFPLVTRLEMDVNMAGDQREALIEGEWRRACEAAGGLAAARPKPDCTPE